MMANKIDRINHLIAASAGLRDQLEAMAIEFASLHNSPPGSNDWDDLYSVIRDGDNYEGVMLSIRRRHAKRRKS